MVGFFSKSIKRAQESFRKLSERQAKDTRVGPRITKHEAITERCAKCGKMHSINEHRFHGEGSHLRTHGDEGEGAKRYEFDVGGTGRKGSKAIAKMQREIAKGPWGTGAKPKKGSLRGGKTVAAGPWSVGAGPRGVGKRG